MRIISKKEADRHGTAISRFLDLLVEYQKDEDIFQDRPYSEADEFWKPKDMNKYIRDMGVYLKRVAKEMQPYILFPSEIKEKGVGKEVSKKYKEYFINHFGVLINVCKKGIFQKEELPLIEIADIIKILRKYSVVLGDENAEGLEKIFEYYIDISVVSNDKLSALTEIALYLAEMYRIDGKNIEYEKKLSLIESFVSRVSWYKNELLIERVKYKIEYFEYDAAKELVDKILSICSEELAQMKISKDIYASYLGYLNLCHRADRWSISDEYSDAKYFENSYNTRQIVIRQRDDLSQTFFMNDCKEGRRILPFNEDLIRNSQIFHFGTLSSSYDISKEATRHAVSIAKDSGIFVSFDPNLREMLWNSLEQAKEEMEYGLSQCDILKIADNELEFLTGTENYDIGVQMINQKYHIPLICVTLGAEGSIAYYKEQKVRAHSFLLEKTIETTGAGDAFMACMLNYILEHGLERLTMHQIEEMLIFANAAAALVTTRKGALRVMPRKREIEELIKTYSQASYTGLNGRVN